MVSKKTFFWLLLKNKLQPADNVNTESDGLSRTEWNNKGHSKSHRRIGHNLANWIPN